MKGNNVNFGYDGASHGYTYIYSEPSSPYCKRTTPISFKLLYKYNLIILFAFLLDLLPLQQPEYCIMFT